MTHRTTGADYTWVTFKMPLLPQKHHDFSLWPWMLNTQTHWWRRRGERFSTCPLELSHNVWKITWFNRAFVTLIMEEPWCTCCLGKVFQTLWNTALTAVKVTGESLTSLEVPDWQSDLHSLWSSENTAATTNHNQFVSQLSESGFWNHCRPSEPAERSSRNC